MISTAFCLDVMQELGNQFIRLNTRPSNESNMLHHAIVILNNSNLKTLTYS
jgi:hypothetical protein